MLEREQAHLQTSTEDVGQGIVDRYSTPSLRRNEIPRDVKRVLLLEQYSRTMTRDEINDLLDVMYPQQIINQDAGMSI